MRNLIQESMAYQHGLRNCQTAVMGRGHFLLKSPAKELKERIGRLDLDNQEALHKLGNQEINKQEASALTWYVKSLCIILCCCRTLGYSLWRPQKQSERYQSDGIWINQSPMSRQTSFHLQRGYMGLVQLSFLSR